MATVTMRKLLEAGIHFGHQTRRWNPKMKPYIYGQRNGIYIIDLQHTMRQLQRAYITVRDTVANGGTVLFVGTKRQAQDSIKREAERCGMYYMNNRWLGGTLTNFQTIKNSVKGLLNLEEMEKTGKLDEFPKKEAILMRKETEKLNKNLCGIKTMGRVPQVMFVIDTKKERIAVNEAHRLKIPCIGIVDTNCDPEDVPIPIPGNDDAIRAINFYCSVIADAVLEGRMREDKIRAEKAQEEAEIARANADSDEELEEAEAVQVDDEEVVDTAEEAAEVEIEEEA